MVLITGISPEFKISLTLLTVFSFSSYSFIENNILLKLFSIVAKQAMLLSLYKLNLTVVSFKNAL